MPIQMKRPSKTVALCTDMSLAAEHERLEAQLRETERDELTDPRLVKKSAAKGLATQVQKIEQAMADSTLLFTLTALPRKRWAELEEDHPPRDGDSTDEVHNVNLSTFIDAAMLECVQEVTQKKTGEKVEYAPRDWSGLADEMTNAQWEAFALAVLQLNKADTAPSFSKAASRVIRSSASK